MKYNYINAKKISDLECVLCKSLMFVQEYSNEKNEHYEHYTCSNSSCNGQTCLRNYVR